MTAAHIIQLVVAVLTAVGGTGFGAAAWKWWAERDERAVGTMQDVLATVKEELVKVRRELDGEKAARQADKEACERQIATLYVRWTEAQQENARLCARLEALEAATRREEGP